MGFICDANGRHPDTSKVLKILDWSECTNVTPPCTLMGVCVYYQIWIKNFAQVASPIYHLFKKNIPFIWGKEQVKTMDLLKFALTSPPALVSLDYIERAGDIILAVDASLEGWGGVLMQLVKEKRHPSRYESKIWSTAEKKYNAAKRECRGVLKALKKVKYWLYGVRFILETDARVLVAQLNRSRTDLPRALVTRWIAWIQLYNFELYALFSQFTRHLTASHPPTSRSRLSMLKSMIDMMGKLPNCLLGWGDDLLYTKKSCYI